MWVILVNGNMLSLLTGTMLIPLKETETETEYFSKNETKKKRENENGNSEMMYLLCVPPILHQWNAARFFPRSFHPQTCWYTDEAVMPTAEVELTSGNNTESRASSTTELSDKHGFQRLYVWQ